MISGGHITAIFHYIDIYKVKCHRPNSQWHRGSGFLPIETIWNCQICNLPTNWLRYLPVCWYIYHNPTGLHCNARYAAGTSPYSASRDTALFAMVSIAITVGLHSGTVDNSKVACFLRIALYFLKKVSKSSVPIRLRIANISTTSTIIYMYHFSSF